MILVVTVCVGKYGRGYVAAGAVASDRETPLAEVDFAQTECVEYLPGDDIVV